MKTLFVTLCALISLGSFADIITPQELDKRQLGGTLYSRGFGLYSLRFLCDKNQDSNHCQTGAIYEVSCRTYGAKKDKDCEMYNFSPVQKVDLDENIKARSGGHDFLNSMAPMGVGWSIYALTSGAIPLGILMLGPAIVYDVAATPFRLVIGAGKTITASIRIRQFLRSIRNNNRKFKRKVGRRTFDDIVYRL